MRSLKIPGKIYSQTLVPLQLINSLCILHEELEVTLYGFPKVPELIDLNYAAPESKDTDYNEIENSLCQGTSLVSSKGKIKKVGNIISVSCVAANGMSGGPLIIESENVPIVIGFLQGGPTSVLHHYFSRLLNSMKASLVQVFISYLSDSFDLRNMNFLRFLHELLTKYITSTISPSGIDDLEYLLFYVYYNAVRYEYVRGKNISYNNCLSIIAIFEPLIKVLNSYLRSLKSFISIDNYIV